MQTPPDAFEQGVPLNKSQARALQRQKHRDKGLAPGSRVLVAKTEAQKTLLRHLFEGTSIFAVGGAGVGKTYLSSRVAAKALLSNKVERIIIARATIAKQKHHLGFLPGNLESKLKPWLVPILDGLRAEVSNATIDAWKADGRLEFLSFEHMRGRTLDNAFVILDEAQNCDITDLQLFLTRSGENTQIVVTGDLDQVDIPASGLDEVVNIAEANPTIPMIVVRFSNDDVVRSELAKAWVKVFSQRNKSDSVKGFLDAAPDFLNNGRHVTKLF